MEHKPSYEELTQRVKDLEEKVARRTVAEHDLLLTKFSVDAASICILWLNPDGKFVYANKAACQKLGYSQEEILGLNICVVDPSFSDDSRVEQWQRLKHRQVLSYKSLHYAKDGTIFPVAVTDHYLQYDGHEYEFVFAVDVTECEQSKKALFEAYNKLEERVQERTAALVKANQELHRQIEEREKVEFALRQSEEKFRTIADFTYNWEYWVSPRGESIYHSPSCKPLTGYGPEIFQENPRMILEIAHPDDKARLEKHLAREFDEDHACHFDFRIITRDGKVRWVSHTCQPVYSADGKYLGRRASNRNVTLRKTAELEKEKLIVELQDALGKVKLLSGFLPICAACKKIRDDKGYWKQIEQYIRDHSEADFSHSICPECARRLYPDLFKVNPDLLADLEEDADSATCKCNQNSGK